MASIDTTLVANTLQPKYSKQLLAHAVKLTCLADYAVKSDMPANAGATSIRFFRPPSADLAATGAPAALSEGVKPTNNRTIAMTPIDIALGQRGQTTEVTDVANNVGLIKFLDVAINLMCEEYALDVDTIIRNQLSHATTGLTKRYAQGLATFAALAGASLAAGCMVPRDVLDAMTRLKLNRAPTIQGKYVCVLPPQLSRDVLNSDLWREVIRQNYADRIFKGEIGDFFGCRFVEQTNPFQEDETEGTHTETFVGTGTNTTGLIYSAYVLGQGAYGTPNMAKLGQAGFNKPSVIINAAADKSDPLNQKVVAGWKAMWGSAVLNPAFGVALRTKSQFVG